MLEKGRTLYEVYQEAKRNSCNNYDYPSLSRRKTCKRQRSVNGNFNLFEILSGDDNINEVVSRFLCELISPDGRHNM